jgi:hypothetical protein
MAGSSLDLVATLWAVERLSISHSGPLEASATPGARQHLDWRTSTSTSDFSGRSTFGRGGRGRGWSLALELAARSTRPHCRRAGSCGTGRDGAPTAPNPEVEGSKPSPATTCPRAFVRPSGRPSGVRGKRASALATIPTRDRVPRPRKPAPRYVLGGWCETGLDQAGERSGMLPAAMVRSARCRLGGWVRVARESPSGPVAAGGHAGLAHAATQPSDGVQCRPSTPSRARLTAAASRLRSAATLTRPRTRTRRPPWRRRTRWASLRSTLGRVAR